MPGLSSLPKSNFTSPSNKMVGQKKGGYGDDGLPDFSTG